MPLSGSTAAASWAKASHADDGLAPRLRRVGCDLEGVAVLFARHADPIRADFFAGEPGAPRRDTAGAIGLGAAQAWRDADPVTISEQQVGGAGAKLVGRRCAVVPVVVHPWRVDEIRRARTADFVIAYQHQLGAATGLARDNHAHAVVAARPGLAVRHGVAAPAEALVRKSGRQLQQRQAGCHIGDRRNRSVRAVDQGRGAVGRTRFARLHRSERANERQDGCRSQTFEQAAPRGGNIVDCRCHTSQIELSGHDAACRLESVRMDTAITSNDCYRRVTAK